MHLSWKEWCAAVEHLCVQRLKKSIVTIQQVTALDMEDAYNDGASPEEFFEVDVRAALNLEESHGIQAK